jgi:threonine dehydratase
MAVTFQNIQVAAERIKGEIIDSPCPKSIPLSELTGMQIYCKLEYLQRTGSFKERGARNALLQLSPEKQKRGVIAASAGNHALGLAYHSQLLKIPATVVMPKFAPLTKVGNCRRFGATVILHGADLAEARLRADEIAAEKDLAYLNGYDDPQIIAGQGTLGLEIARQAPDLDAIIVPIGGGGLIAGIAVALKTLKPSVQIIGVEPDRAASFTAAMAAGKPVTIDLKPTLADGLSVAKVGINAFGLAAPLIKKIVTASEHEIARAILSLMEMEKAVVEGAGAASLAACLAGSLPELLGKKVLLPLCGGNIDMSTLDRVLSRGLAMDGRLFKFSATLSDRPGGLARFATLIADEGASILEISHDRAFSDEDITSVTVYCVVETRDRSHITQLCHRLDEEGFHVRKPDLASRLT